MVEKLPWNDRRFEGAVTLSLFPLIIERLRGTPARLEDRIQDVPTDLLRKRVGEAWSIQETIGHLILAETLWGGRIDDFIKRKDELRPVSENHQKRSYAEYNDWDSIELLDSFRTARFQVIEKLEGLTDDDLAHEAVLPRLNQAMRVVDLMFFAAEHDDHHLAIITEVMRTLEE